MYFFQKALYMCKSSFPNICNEAAHFEKVLFYFSLNKSENSSSISSQLRLANFWGKRRANTSNVWDHFGFKINDDGVIINKTKATCKYCFAEVKYVGGNTSNLSSHYNNNHGNKDEVDKITLQPSISAAFGAVKKYPKGSNHQVMLQRKVVKFLIADLRPLSTLDSPAFRNLCAALDPKFNIPDKKTIPNTVLPNFGLQTRHTPERHTAENLKDECMAYS